MRSQLLVLISLCMTGIALAQTEESEELITLSPFEVSTGRDRDYRASSSLTGTRVATPLVDPTTAQNPAPVAVSIVKRADAVAVQFVLSHAADKQEVRNQELYASVAAIETAVKNLSGVRMEQREVRFTGGDRKLFSVTRGNSMVSFVSILLLADLPAGVRVVDRVKQVHDLLASTKLAGQTKYSDGSVGLYLKNPDQYRREILQKIFDDFEFVRKGFGDAFEVQPSGLNGKIRMRVAGEAELELWIDYSFSFRSVREMDGAKKK